MEWDKLEELNAIVNSFGNLMVKELAANIHKGDRDYWRNMNDKIYLNELYYQNKPVTEPPKDTIGFIYKISRISYIDEISPKIYIGKKIFFHRTKSKIGKREKLATKTKKRVKITLKDSKWLTYQSSCLPLQQDIKLLGIENFTFEILEFCKDKRKLSYKEVWWQFHLNVLEVESYNGNILGRFFKPKQ